MFNRVDVVLGNEPQKLIRQDGHHTLDVTYADDTLLISSSACSVQRLQSNWAKTLHLRVGQKDRKPVHQAVITSELLAKVCV